MCQSHPGPEITQEYLNSLAALADYTLPTPAALQATALPNGWEPVPGEVPAPYQAELYTGISDAEGGEGTRRRSTTGENGRSRNLVFPPAPEPLPYPIVDNHTHMDLLDGEVEISARDALDAGEKLGIGAIVQVGCDIPSSLYAVAAAQADERVLAAIAIHPNTAPISAPARKARRRSTTASVSISAWRRSTTWRCRFTTATLTRTLCASWMKRARRNVPCSTATRAARSLPRSAMSAAGI